MDGKIFKISGYLVDPSGENSAAWIREEIRHLNDTIGQHVHVKEADIPEWTDDNPLNYKNNNTKYLIKIINTKIRT